MLNQVVIVGKVKHIVIHTYPEMDIVVSVDRLRKEANGTFLTDDIRVALPEGMVKNPDMFAKLKPNGVVGVKGRIVVSHDETGKERVQIVAEKLSILNAAE